MILPEPCLDCFVIVKRCLPCFAIDDDVDILAGGGGYTSLQNELQAKFSTQRNVHNSPNRIET